MPRVGTALHHLSKKDKNGHRMKGKIVGTYPAGWDIRWEDGTKTFSRDLTGMVPPKKRQG